MPDQRRLLLDLAAQVGPTRVYSRPADLAAYSFDAYGASGHSNRPVAVVFPSSAQEVSAIVKICRHHGVSLTPRGAGTGYSGGAVAADGGVILCLTRMNRILGVEAEAKRIHAQAGAITADVHSAASRHGLMYPPDPGSASTSTIGGNVACNASGPHHYRYGATADYVVGLTAVLASGEIVELGELGVGGYDLMSLLIASEGTLAVVTDVLLRLIPASPSKATLRATFATFAQAVNVLPAIADAGIVPAALECMDRAALRAVRKAGITDVDDSGALIMVELDGDAQTVNRDAQTVRSAMERAGALRTDHAANAEEAARMWAVRKSISAAVARVQIGKINEDVVVPRDRAGDLADAVQAIAERHNVESVLFGHLGDGNLHVSFLIDPRRSSERQRGMAAVNELFEVVLGMGGSLSGEHGVGTSKLAFVERQLGPGGVAVMQRIKDELDPGCLFNPGKVIPVPAGASAA